ncbi:nitrogen regulatory protein [Hymenobacter roseosalivarius DSM 11622]|uniref:Nitrogen regulatory protein n=1 Tax=Hymenobacter roseosalivarius DSM 11622 TaxID=645990 RepID=A0A1W1V3S1_9BACT|nr:PIN domain-containing protein [Hymenobacter roseosalivarius]SMB87903.1 nitrogen regulatory protein [Hymenobacter roseosalivarius DSM 11622]
MSQFLLDTNICIHWSKDEFGLRQKLQQVGPENCFISELTIAEMLYGVAKSASTKQVANRHSLDILRQAFAGHILLVADGFELYAQEKARLRSIGRLVDDFDLLIGCTASRSSPVTPATSRNCRKFGWKTGLMTI